MIRMVMSTTAKQAEAYFSNALQKSDYYINDQELQGVFYGKLAKRLNIEGPASKEAFSALCENRRPENNIPLTSRTKANRRVGYDINFHCPKSVSILHALSKDDHMLEAFQSSVHQTMLEIEADSKTRVRKGNKEEDRHTGELVWAEFVHQTARPVRDDVPDPHLHSHCFVFNSTWDDVEKVYKAAQLADVKRDMPYYQARFHKRLADRLVDLGYNVWQTRKSFEVEGVPQDVINLFAKRTNEIGRIAKEKGITDARELDALGARTRSKKQKGLSMAELKTEWRKQIQDLNETTKDDTESNPIRFGPKKEIQPLQEEHAVEQALDHAISHCFERASVVSGRRLLSEAYRYALGDTSVTLNGIYKWFVKDERLLHLMDKGNAVCTTKEVLNEERHMIALAKQGRSTQVPLYTTDPEIYLTGQQRAAVKHLLTTTDRVSIIRGAAGSGKTALMKDAVKLMEQAGKKVMVVAPTSHAAHGVLKEEGFEQADTVAKLLIDKEMQAQLTNQVLWVDEAGLLGTKDMVKLLEIATAQNARLILGGDTRQHSSVVRGDALRILNTVGGIKTAEVNKIYRQRNADYRAAVEDLSKGNIADGFKKLENIKAIKEVDPANPNYKLVNDYVEALKKGKSAIVISPTHQRGEEVTEEIRNRLRLEGLIGEAELKFSRLVNLNLTEAEKMDGRNFKEGHCVQFSQHVPGFKRGSIWKVKVFEDRHVFLADEKGGLKPLPAYKARHYDVFEKAVIGLSQGDQVRMTRNGFDEKKNRINNGQILEVDSVTGDGNIMLKNSQSKVLYEVPQDFAHLTHAHCISSHASQGRTVDEAFISQPAGTFCATDAKQFYVSVSRGRDNVTIYTDDKAGLLEHARALGDRKSAIELVRAHHRVHMERLYQMEPALEEIVQENIQSIMHRSPLTDRNYEPAYRYNFDGLDDDAVKESAPAKDAKGLILQSVRPHP